MTQSIPLVDLKAQYESIKTEIGVAIAEILRTTRFVGGAPLQTFEADFARYCQVQDAVGVGNGTDAIVIALEILGVGPGDDVLLPAHTFIATAEAVSLVGARPVFTDVDPETGVVRAQDIEARLTPRTKALIPVHLYGNPAPMDEIMSLATSKNLLVVEDCAQAHGALYKGEAVGTFGHAGTFSFYPGKNLGAYGDGGAVVSRSQDVTQRCRLIRDHGRTTKYLHEIRGRNSRLDSLQAAILSVKLAHLESWNKARRQAAATYDELIGESETIRPLRCTPESLPVYHLYVVRVPERDQVLSNLNSEGVQAQIHYPVPLHKQPAYADEVSPVALPGAEKLTAAILSLPLFPEITREQQQQVVAALKKAVGQVAAV